MLLMSSLMMGGIDMRAQDVDVTFATYNIRYAATEDVAKGNGWNQRAPIISAMMRFHDFQIVGLQEVQKKQLNDIMERMPGYAYIGVGNKDGKSSGEYNPIIYRSDLFEVIESGTFWLSETSDTPSMGWDAKHYRICTWALFKHIASGKEFYFMNTHLDNAGSLAKTNGAKLLRKQIDAFRKEYPVVLTGDFNSDEVSEPYKTILGKRYVQDAYEAADLVYALNGTYNGFQSDRYAPRRIDHIFLTGEFKVKMYGVLTDSYRLKVEDNDPASANSKKKKDVYEVKIPSDHFPVKVVASF